MPTPEQYARMLAVLRAFAESDPQPEGLIACIHCEGEAVRDGTRNRIPQYTLVHAPDCPWVAAGVLVNELEVSDATGE